MGAFFLVRKDSGVQQELVVQKIRNQFEKQGFSSPNIVTTREYDLYVYPKLITDNDNFIAYEGNNYSACTGTLIYKEKIGTPALSDLYEHYTPQSFSSNELYGAYCLITSKEGRTYLQIDQLGIYKVYKNSTNSIWSSSLLAVVAGQTDVAINTQGVYEYVFQGATYGNDTLFEKISLVEAGEICEIGGLASTHNLTGKIEAGFVDQNLESHLETSSKNLNKYYKAIKNGFGDNVDTALSGGFDSRLTLALLQHQGIKPKVHVYGKSTDEDVRIATNIDDHESLGLQHIDKSDYQDVTLDEFPSIIAKNFLAFDGCPTDGIFDNGQDLKSRSNRCSDGKLMLNGGGGEVFRNFFYLPEKRFTVKGLLWSFYSRFDPKTCSNKFNEQVYHSNLGNKIKKALSTDQNKLSRAEVELAYPVFRCRYWMGKNNAINNKFGYALTPFIDYNIVLDAMKIPLKFKYFGLFEGRLIKMTSAKLASYPSAYGYSFSHDAPLKNRLKERATYLRPEFLRKHSYRIQMRRKRLELPYFLTKPYRDVIFEDDFKYMSDYFNLDMINDSEQYRRICTLEYLFQQTKPKLEG